MKKIPNIRLDILIKKEEDYYIAHCLQFDIVATNDTIKGVQKAIANLCIAHIQFSIKHDNVEHLFHPAPPEVWAEYYSISKNPNCLLDQKEIKVKLRDEIPNVSIPPFIIQEVFCDEQTAC
jgi:hypothetical protein